MPDQKISSDSRLTTPPASASVPIVSGGSNYRLEAQDARVWLGFGRRFRPEQYDSTAGSGASRTLSAAGYTLAAAQTKFGATVATNITQQLDFCCIQKAINDAAAAGGGVVDLQSGQTYTTTGPGATTIDTLVIPNSGAFGLGSPVDIIGGAMGTATIQCLRDLGTGNFAISCGDPTASRANGLGRYAAIPTGDFSGIFAEFNVVGPNAAGVLGVAPCNMQGIAWGARRRVYNVTSQRFYAGWNFVGDHSFLQGCHAIQCYYGYYFPQSSSALFGDIIFEKCTAQLSSMAAIGIHDDSQITSCEFHSVFMGTAPYGIFGEAGTVKTAMLANCVFSQCMWEDLGNAMIHDDNATKARQIYTVNFLQPFMYFNDTYLLTTGGRTRRALWDFATVNDTELVLPREVSLIWPSTNVPSVALFSVTDTFSGFRIRGNIYGLVAAIPNGKFFTSAISNVDVYSKLMWEDMTGRRGGFGKVAAGTVTANMLLENTGTGVQPAGTASGLSPIGVALARGAVGDIVPYVSAGPQVTCVLSGTAPTSGQYLKKNTNNANGTGAVIAATGPNDGPIVGVQLWNDSASQVRMWMRPQV